MSYLVFDSHDVYTAWSTVINEQLGFPDEYAKRYTKQIVHPTTGQWACVFNAGDYVQPPDGAIMVEDDYMFQHEWFHRNGE